MIQFNLFDEVICEPKKVKKRVGRPHKISPETVFLVLDSIKKNHTNKDIIKSFNVSERTFFRIKRGEFNHLLQQYLDETVHDFSLDFTD